MRARPLALLLLLTGCGDDVTSTDAAPDAITDVSSDSPVSHDVADATVDATIDATADAPTLDTVTVDASADATDAAPDVQPGVPLEAPVRTWTWIPIEGAVCDDGSPTGVGVNLVPDAPGVMVFLNGGGACWDYNTCAVTNTSTHGPFGGAQFAAASAVFTSSIFDRSLAGNPLASWSYVFVPYCTGDLHAGDRVASYAAGSNTRTVHHKGRANLQRLLPRLVATMAPGARVALVGASTGGLGATLNHDLFRSAMPASRVYVIDDSGPLLGPDAMPASTRALWYSAWNLSWLDGPCPACREDLSLLYTVLASRYASDRTALLASRQDPVMRSFFGLDAAGFEARLDALVATFNALPARRAFVRNGTTHTSLGRPADPSAAAADGTALLPWLTEMLSDDAAWRARGP